MKCLAYSDNADLHSQLLRFSSLDRSNRKCTDRIVGWGDSNSHEALPSTTKTVDNVKEKQVIRDFMQRNAPSTVEKQYKFQHHFDPGYYMLQYNIQHTLHFNPSSILYHPSNSGHIGHQTRFRIAGQSQTEGDQQNVGDISGNTPSQIGNTYMNGVWTIAQKYHLPPPSLAQYANWWKGQENSKTEEDTKVPIFGKGLLTSGKNAPVSKCTLKFPSESSSSPHAKKQISDAKSIDESDIAKLSAKLRNEDLRDTTCKFFTPVLEYRLSLLKQQKDELEKSESMRSPTPSVGRRRPISGNLPKLNREESLIDLTTKISISTTKSNSDHRPSLPQMPHFKFVSIRQNSEK